MAAMGKLLVVLGLGLAALGALVWLGARWELLSWVGRLPGDFVIRRGDTTIYIPLTTCLLASLLLTALVWLARRW
jgi:hypothetical protein